MDQSSRAERGYCRGMGNGGEGDGDGKGTERDGDRWTRDGGRAGEGDERYSNEGDEGRNKRAEDTVCLFFNTNKYKKKTHSTKALSHT